jgi:hypothetical protein
MYYRCVVVFDVAADRPNRLRTGEVSHLRHDQVAGFVLVQCLRTTEIITAVYESASGSDIGQRQGARSLAINVCEAVLHRKGSGHQHGSGVTHDVGIAGKRRDGTSDELGGF